MRLECVAAVSSALLFLLGALGPHHISTLAVGCEQASVQPSARAVISEFYPYALAGDEYVAVANVGDVDIHLLNWSLSDGEGSVTVQAETVLAVGRSAAFSFNSSSYTRAYGRPPEFALDDTENVSVSGTFRLANDGDSIELRSSSGEPVDFVCYGEAKWDSDAWVGDPLPCLRPGEVAKRLGGASGPVDSDSSADWTPFRQYKYGYTSLESAAFDLGPGEVTCFVSPDCALGPVVSMLEGARERIRVCAYEIESPHLTGALLAALCRGVSVEVLAEGKPVGGMSEDQIMTLSTLAASGAEVMIIDGVIAEGVARHIGALHAKYIVADGSVALVGSENFVNASLSEDPVFGNRGWWAMMTNEGIAQYLDLLFEADSRADRPDVVNWLLDERYDPSAVFAEPPPVRQGAALIEPMVTERPSRATLFVSPDSSIVRPYIVDELSACSSCLAEQMQVDLLWLDRWTGNEVPSPILESFMDMLRRGGDGEMLLDSSWFSRDNNLGVVDYLRACAQQEGLSGEFALIADESPVEVMHNKGIVFDERRALVSSNNWVRSSFSSNRELGVLLESEEVARYFGRAFEVDWVPDVTPPAACAGADVSASLGDVVRLSAAASTDDRLIAGYTWDVGGDGRIDGRGPDLEFVASRPGRIEVVLAVVDSWGNRATDMVVVEVVPELASADEDGCEEVPWLACATGLGAACGILLARRGVLRRARSRPRKINHPRAMFRRRDTDPAVRPGGHPGCHEDSEGLAR